VTYSGKDPINKKGLGERRGGGGGGGRIFPQIIL